ncbi:hypothetical protein [Ochrovirga pacifica]|uniref:hypothetical protein n=1 Tax=Ochrovirga pacifica TaxID=1042376 RepID=UPI0002557FF3|nr:hypothetical protein [Ochrovirga pacifica]
MKQATSFPYSVEIHTIELSELPHSSINFEYEIRLPDYFISDNKYKTIKSNIDVIAEVNCSATMFRKVFKAKNDTLVIIQIPRKNVAVNFNIDVLVVANKNIIWEGQQIQKGMPIAHFGSHKKDIDNRSKGLISFETSENNQLTIATAGNTIVIQIPKKQYEFLVKKQNDKLVKEVLTSQFAQIALLEACKYLKEGSNLDHLLWHKALLSKWRKYSSQETGFPNEKDHLKFISDMLKNPSISLVNHLIAVEKQNEDE